MANIGATRLHPVPVADPSASPAPTATPVAPNAGTPAAQNKTSDPVTVSVPRSKSLKGPDMDPNELIGSLTEAIRGDKNAMAAHKTFDAARVFDLLRDDDA